MTTSPKRSHTHAAAYLPLLEELAQIEPPLFIMGGIAEDALLHGAMSREHEDVDVLILQNSLEQYLPRFAELGFSQYHLFLEDPAGRPTVLNCRRGEVALELCIADRTEDGEVYFYLAGAPDETPYRIYMPSGTFSHEVSRVDGVPIRTVSPLALYHMRAGLGVTNSFGGFRPKDRVAQAALRSSLLADASEDLLTPRVEVSR